MFYVWQTDTLTNRICTYMLCRTQVLPVHEAGQRRPFISKRAHPVSVYCNGSFMVAGCWLQQSGPGALLSLFLSLFFSFSPSMINGPIAGLNYFLQISFRALKKRSTLFIHFTFAPSFNIFVYACKESTPPTPYSQEKEGKKQFAQCT